MQDIREAGTLERAITETETAIATTGQIPPAQDTAERLDLAKTYLGYASIAMRQVRNIIAQRGPEPERGDGKSYSQLKFYPADSNVDP